MRNDLTKWTRYIARTIALTWALWWIFFGLASSYIEKMNFIGTLVHMAVPGFIFLISAAIAWIWESVGGIILILEGLIILIGYPLLYYNRLSTQTIVFTLLILALPALIAGFCFYKLGKTLEK